MRRNEEEGGKFPLEGLQTFPCILAQAVVKRGPCGIFMSQETRIPSHPLLTFTISISLGYSSLSFDSATRGATLDERVRSPHTGHEEKKIVGKTILDDTYKTMPSSIKIKIKKNKETNEKKIK